MYLLSLMANALRITHVSTLPASTAVAEFDIMCSFPVVAGENVPTDVDWNDGISSGWDTC